MLQALLHHKLGAAISSGDFKQTEDTLTSSVFGLLQYLPDNLFWQLIQASCGSLSSDWPQDIGCVKRFYFWKKLSPERSYNSNFVEPDILVETDYYVIIIESKRSDSPKDNSQQLRQWENEIKACLNEYKDEKKIVFIALGGNDHLRDDFLRLDGNDFIIHTASWFNLLGAIRKMSIQENLSGNVKRILNDAIAALNKHGILYTVWISSLKKVEISDFSFHTITSLWKIPGMKDL